MHDLILRIFFSGLITIVPSEDGKKLTVFLLNEPHAHQTAAGPVIEEHKPIMLARAGACTGDCTRSDREISTFLYPELSATAAAQSLAGALNGGTVWHLAGSDLSLGIPDDGVTLTRVASAVGKSVPDTITERTDFRWVANLKEIDPSIGRLDPAIFSDNPPKELIVARLQLTSGTVSTHSLVRVKGKAMPIDFSPLSGKGPHYIRAAASWVLVEIKVPGSSLEVVERNFKGTPKRTVTLTGLNNVIEMAILNVTRPVLPDRRAQSQAGMHFERYWELADTPPAADRRSIPQPPRRAAVERNWEILHVADATRFSALLHDIFFRDSRTTYDQALCPMSQYPLP